jgi:hypothetical protein
MIPMRQLNVLAATLGVAMASLSCGSVVRNGSSPMFLVINTLQGQRGGATLGTLGTPLDSSVLTFVTSPAPCTAATPCPTYFSDVGQVVLALVAKNLSTNTAGPSSPSTNNEVTITRYHVAYTRGDCDPNCKPGVDVPFAFDGAVTGTIQVGGSLTLGFELVRIVAKQEPPLAALASTTNVLTTIANVTFYGQDLVGNAIQATGTIQIDFGTFSS